jgi:SAM-dependent methyltransferase
MKNDNSTHKFPHDNWAEYYDYVYEKTYGSVYEGFTKTSLDTILGLIVNKPSALLDFGAGTGRLSIPLALKNFDVISVEQSLPMLDVLKRKSKGLNLEIETHNCSIQNYNGRSTDLAICVFTVLNYITDSSELQKICDNAYNHLKNGGLFFFDLADSGFFNNGESTSIERGNLKRVIKIIHDHDNVFTYIESCNGILNGRNFEYNDKFPLRYWEHDEVHQLLVNSGFTRVLKTFPQFNNTGSEYFLYQK